jgi:hypothetical protein
MTVPQYVELFALCHQLKVKPEVARNRLRKAGLRPPNGEWKFEKGSEELEIARAAIKGDK